MQGIEGVDVFFLEEIVDASNVFTDFSATEFVDFCHQAIQELAVMADDDDRAVKGKDSFLEHIFRAHVKVVGRLVEDKEVHRLQQQAYHGQSATFSARKHLHFFL